MKDIDWCDIVDALDGEIDKHTIIQEVVRLEIGRFLTEAETHVDVHPESMPFPLEAGRLLFTWLHVRLRTWS